MTEWDLVLRAAVFLTALFVFLSIFTCCVESLEIKLISPIGAATRSIVPGWGQIYTHSKLKGAIIFLSVGILAGGGLRSDARYRDIYNNDYKAAVLDDSGQADFYFDRSNQYYKLSRFLLYTAAGIWAYSAIDAYIDAHIYNSQQQVKMLKIDDRRLLELKSDTELSKAIDLRESYLFSLYDLYEWNEK